MAKPPKRASALTAVRGRVAHLLAPIQALWASLVTDLEAIRGAPAVAALLVVCAALMFMEQGADLAVTAGSDTCKASWMVLATAFYGFQCWFWTRYIIEQHRRRAPQAFARQQRESRLIAWLREWTPRLLGGGPFFIAGVATLRAEVDLWALPYIFFALGLVAVFVLWARRRVTVYFRLDHRQLSRLTRWATFVLGLGSMALLCVWPVGPSQFLGAISIVFLGLAFITAALAAMLHASRATRLPVLTGLVFLALAFSLVNDNHAIGRRTLQRRADADRAMPLPPARPVAPDAAERPDPRTGKDTIAMRLKAWCAAQGPQACQPNGPETPIVFVAAQGGASRAGYWAADVLGKLQYETQGPKPFSDRVFAISSVSGGSVGVMAYVSTLADRPDLSGAPFADSLAEVAGIDYLSPAVSGLLFPDLAQRFLPVAVPLLPDRAETLETGFEAGWRQHCLHPDDADIDPGPGLARCRDADLWTKPFLSLWRPAAGSPAPSWLPIVMINGARQEDGRRIITADVAITPEDFPNAVDFHALAGRDVRISTAIHNGARFPLVSPGGTLIDAKRERQGHLLDGGYFDGGGVTTMGDVAAAALRLANAGNFKLKPVFIELNNATNTDDTAADLIRAGAEVCEAPSDGETPPGCEPNPLFRAKPQNFAPDLLGPLLGLAASRGSHDTAAAMALAQTVRNHGGDIAPDDRPAPGEAAATAGPEEAGEWGVSPTYRLVHLCKPSSGQVPMDWALSKSAMQHADEALGIRPTPKGGQLLIAQDLKMKSACLAETRVRDILLDVDPTAVVGGGQTRPAPGQMKRLDLWAWLAATGLAALVGALAVGWADRKLRKMKLPATLGLQRCRTAGAFDRAVARWRAASADQSKVFAYVWAAFGFDLLLIAGYAGFAVVLALLLIANQPVSGAGVPVHAYLTPVFRSAAGLVLLAAIADLVEDGLEAWMIAKGARDGAARAARIATLAKWVLLTVGALALVVGAVLGCERGG
ncbi:hypothetical protein ASD21_10180 [Caulobacter sp. Root1455]|uniref:hypothetical protein n=1 Tax=Caulobacter sp. Root1455 TaxID=1736465 RepID=UPI000701FDF2|nr:hypothetical protein [Caulobacter sp. Root1455]KQY93942.1 hypothetical protein ASD21_10180 [Caulobacter sp. Root1455]